MAAHQSYNSGRICSENVGFSPAGLSGQVDLGSEGGLVIFGQTEAWAYMDLVPSLLEAGAVAQLVAGGERQQEVRGKTK